MLSSYRLLAHDTRQFSVTGWKIGWAIGPARLIEAMWRVHQFVCFTIATPLQEAVGDAFEQCRSNNYFKEFSTMLQQKRDRLVDIVNQAGMSEFDGDKDLSLYPV